MRVRLATLIRAASWRHAVAEIAFIVVGVLIALGANSWWQAREDRARERVILEQLAAATDENVKRINSAIEQDSFYRTHATQLLGVMRGSATPSSPDSVGLWFVAAGAFSDFHPLTGVYTALLSTGELNLLRNDPLHSSIANGSQE